MPNTIAIRRAAPELVEGAAFGRRLPQLWDHLAAARRKALLRCLIDKVVIHRSAPDEIALRIVWRGGAVTALTVPVTVGSLTALSCAAEMEARLLELARNGHSDQEIAAELTRAGHRSPMRDRVLPSTVQIIRLKHRVLRNRCQSHPRRIAGSLTVPQLAHRIQTAVHWIYDRIHNGTIAVARDEKTGLYLFPDTPATVANLKRLKAGHTKAAS